MNREKCSLVGLNLEEELLFAFADLLGCCIGRISFICLGVKIKSMHEEKDKLEYMVRKVKNRLRKWKDLNLSIGGRLTLINSVLSSLPVYIFSIYYAPKIP